MDALSLDHEIMATRDRHDDANANAPLDHTVALNVCIWLFNFGVITSWLFSGIGSYLGSCGQ